MITTVTMHPSRIGCPSIPGTMKGIIASLPGVREVSVRYEDRSVDVTYDDAQTSPDAIAKVIGNELGLHLEAGEPSGSKDGSVADTCPM